MKKLFCCIFFLAFAGLTLCYAQNPLEGTWTGKLEAGRYSLTVVLNFTSSEDGTTVCTLDSPDQGVKGVPTQLSVVSSVIVNVTVPSIGATFKGLLTNSSSISGTFSQSGMDFPVTFRKGEEVVVRPQTPQPPFPYSEEEVTFVNEEAGATLAGTLVVPEGASGVTPVVIMISGSGQEDRNEEVYEHKPFLVIADYLARCGIASLRYDDRAFGASVGGDVKNATSLDFKEDALSGIRFLKERAWSGPIGALGHSEGASIAFMLGAAGECDFVVSLAGIGVKGDAALTAQSNKILELSGMDKKIDINEYRAMVMMENNPWLNWFIDYDPSADIRGCECPVFAVNGDEDVQVISSLNLTAIKGLLSDSPSNFVKEYPGLNHLFQHCTAASALDYRQIEETFSPEVLSDLAGWISALQ